MGEGGQAKGGGRAESCPPPPPVWAGKLLQLDVSPGATRARKGGGRREQKGEREL